MPQIHCAVNTRHSVQQIYQLINDIPAYPLFVPGCLVARVLEQQVQKITALMVIGYAGVEKTVVTQNRAILNQSVQLQLITGPLKRLSGGWYLHPLTPGSCQVRFELQFELLNLWLDRWMEQGAKMLADRMVEAFVQRARAIYG